MEIIKDVIMEGNNIITDKSKLISAYIVDY